MKPMTTGARAWGGLRGPAGRVDPFAVRQLGMGRWTAIFVLAVVGGVISGYRWLGAGRDYYDYLVAYAHIEPTFSLAYSRFEPGYGLIAWLFKNVLGTEYEAFTSFVVTISLLIKFYLIHRYLRYAFLATIVYILFLYPIHEYTQIRVAMGIAFGFWAMHLLLARRWLAGGLGIAMSILFHYTMIVFAVALAGTYLLRSRAWMIAGAIVGLAALTLSETLLNFVLGFAGWFNPLSDVYALQNARGLLMEEVNAVSTFNILTYLSLACALTMRWFDEDRYRRTNIALALISVLIMFLFITLPTFAHRLREIFLFAFLLYAFRDARREVDWLAAGFLFLASLVTFYAAFQDEVIAL
jgi:hypothetical protein